MGKFEDYIKIANRDIQYLEEKGHNDLKEYVASLLCRNDELEEENKNLKYEKESIIEYIEKNTEYLDYEKGEVFECMGYRSNRVPIISTSGLLNKIKGEE